MTKQGLLMTVMVRPYARAFLTREEAVGKLGRLVAILAVVQFGLTAVGFVVAPWLAFSLWAIAAGGVAGLARRIETLKARAKG